MKHFCFRMTAIVGIAMGTHFAASRVHAENWSQLNAGTYSWNDGLNWTPASVPNGIGSTAAFTTVGGPSSQSVSLDGAVTLGFLEVSNSSTSYIISNGTSGSLLFDTGSVAT